MFRCEGVKPLVRANHYCGCLFVCLFLIELPDWAIYPCGVIDSVVDQRNIWEASQLISQMSVIFVLFWHTRFPSQSLIGGLTVKDTHTRLLMQNEISSLYFYDFDRHQVWFYDICIWVLSLRSAAPLPLVGPAFRPIGRFGLASTSCDP